MFMIAIFQRKHVLQDNVSRVKCFTVKKQSRNHERNGLLDWQKGEWPHQGEPDDNQKSSDGRHALGRLLVADHAPYRR